MAAAAYAGCQAPCEREPGDQRGRGARRSPITTASTSGRGPRRSAAWSGAEVRLEQHLARGLGAGLGHEHVARPGGQEVGHVEARPMRRRMLGTPPSSRRPWISSASAWLRPPATRTSSPSVNARVDLARAAVRVAQRRLERLGARAHERHAAARAEARARVVHPAAAPGRRAARQRVDDVELLLLDPPVGDPPHAHHRLVLQRDDQVAPVRIGGEVDVGLRRLGRAARVRVVDADLEALVVQLVRREQALVVELVAVGRLARVLGAHDALDERRPSRRR